jgi:imidazole glycerol phosphate synthase subunit HisF
MTTLSTTPTLIIPAIDLKDGKCVRLKQWRMEDDTVFSDDPVAMASRWVKEGARRLHLVDLNGAFDGVPVHKDVVTAIAKAYPNLPIQLGDICPAMRRYHTIFSINTHNDMTGKLLTRLFNKFRLFDRFGTDNNIAQTCF